MSEVPLYGTLIFSGKEPRGAHATPPAAPNCWRMTLKWAA